MTFPLIHKVGGFEPSISIAGPAGFSEKRAGLLSCGNKYDGLVRVKRALREETARIPFFFGFTDSQILSLLSVSTLTLWEQVKTLVKDPSGSSRIVESLLEQLQLRVREDILTGEFSFSDEQMEALAICRDKKLIVRSSSNEDSLAVVNAGGNVSLGGIRPEAETVKQAIAEVVSSYFSDRSFKNRSAFEDPFKDLPLCGVLVMEQIVDPSEEEPVVSGVMMTHKPSWIPGEEGKIPHIAASWGFGQGVVSGRVPSDECVLTGKIAYPTIRNKSHRLVAGEDGNVLERANPPALRRGAVLNERQILQLRAAAREIEDFFKSPMDVEFVFQKGLLYIVQARPIRSQEIKSPTFIDPRIIPGSIPHFFAKTILPGLSEVISVAHEQILFTSDLEEADRLYCPSLHRAVILFKEPESANTHAEVNLASQSPPVPCFLLLQEEWDRCKTMFVGASRAEAPLQICPQTGLLAVTGINFPIRKGLFLHPACFPISIDFEGKGLQGSSSHPKIVRLRELITTTAEQIELNLPEAGKILDDFFVELFGRSSCIGSLRETAEKLQKCASEVFCAMSQAGRERKPTLLSFHATALRQVLGQVAPQVIGAHSLSGIEAATKIAPEIEAFLAEFEDQKVLCELAMMGRKAFDRSMQMKWLAFLRQHSDAAFEARWGALLFQMKKFDAIDQMSLWFSFHFKERDLPPIDALIAQNEAIQDFLNFCEEFIERLRLLSEATVRAETGEELKEAWKGLEAISERLLSFCAECPKENLLQTLQISRLLYELIQLWDLNIKTAQSSKIDPKISDDQAMESRIAAFAEFGKLLVSKGLVNVSETHQIELMKVFEEIFDPFESSSAPFSLQHWLVPKSFYRSPISTNDQRLTVVHQNLLKAIGPKFSDVAPMLPSALMLAVETFLKEQSDLAKRFSHARGIFTMITDRSASVIINIPLNYHSFLLTIRQDKESEALEFLAEWRGSDNLQGDHLPFFEALAELRGFNIQNSSVIGPNLKIVFKLYDQSEIEILSKAIFSVNKGTLDGQDYVRSLALLLHPKKLKEETSKTQIEELRETAEPILDHIWKKLEETGEIGLVFEGFLKRYSSTSYLEKKGLVPKLIKRISEELEGRVPGRRYFDIFGQYILPLLPLERRKELFWSNLMGPQFVVFSRFFPEELKGEMLERLQSENPEKFEAYLLKDPYAHEDLEAFKLTQDV